MAGFRGKYKPVDLLTIGYFLFLNGILAIFGRENAEWYLCLLAHFLLILLVMALIWLENKFPGKFIKFARAWYPMILLPFTYEELGQFVHLIFPYWLDPLIHTFERTLFGVYPTVWLQRIVCPVLTEYFKFAYFSYYLIFSLPAVIFYLKGENDKFDKFMFAIFIAYYLSFIGFILFPVEGPRYALANQYSKVLKGYFFTSLQDWITRLGALHGGCMPSSHVAASLVSLLTIRQYNRGLYYFLLPVVLSLFLSTVYNRDHYLSDVLVGIMVGSFSLRLSNRK